MDLKLIFFSSMLFSVFLGWALFSFFAAREDSFVQKFGNLLIVVGLGFLVIQSNLSVWFFIFHGTLWWISFSDFQEGIIPDGALILLTLLYAWKANFSFSPTIGFRCGLFFALAFFLKIAYHALREKEGLGWGDVKFLTVSGLWISLAALPSFLFITGFAGVLLGVFWRFYVKKTVFPLGPAIAFSLWIHMG
ncbi:MAG: prepilin peptidase [Alphaproteobacteria bacterium]